MDSNNRNSDIIVIGAGYAGLSFAAVMAQEGRKVTVLESHALIGGCASFFKRKGFHFEVGATTLSGLAPGRTLYRLTKILDLQLPTTELELPMAITLNNGKVLKRYREHSAFLKELHRVFPGHTHEKLWQKLRGWESDLWDSLCASQNFPPKSLRDFKKLLRPKILKQAHLGPLAFIPLVSKLDEKMLKDPTLIEFFNEQLMISTQSPAHEVPTLLAAMGMTYPEDMHYIYGGITKAALLLREKIESDNSQVLTRHKVLEVKKEEELFKLRVLRGKNKEEEFTAPLVVSTLPIWNLAGLFKDNEEVAKKFVVKKPSQKKAWGAVVANFGIKWDSPIETLYHQVHYKNHPQLGTGSLFFSFSHPQDHARAPEFHQAVTVSTHTSPSPWEKAHAEGTYDQMKATTLEAILTIFKERFGKNHEILAQSLATPHTFEHYTQRAHGRVGGLAHNKDNNILTFPSQETPLKNFYRIGDTTFPGQGIVGVATGALILAGKLTDKNFLED